MPPPQHAHDGLVPGDTLLSFETGIMVIRQFSDSVHGCIKDIQCGGKTE